MTRQFAVLSLLGTLACTPQSAEMTSGSFTAWLSESTSSTVQQGQVKIGETGDSWAIDCRNLDNESVRLEGAREELCQGDSLKDVDNESWANRGAFHVWSDTIVPWRGEGIITSEGDFQVTFHHRLPGGEDFRFAFVVNPDFQPRRCLQNESGDGVEWQNIDGDWVENWSSTLQTDDWNGSGTSGSLFFLNTGGYQFNPSKTEDLWYLPEEWGAGTARAQFGPETFYARSMRLGMPSAYSAFELEEIDELNTDDLFYAGCPDQGDPELYMTEEIDRVRQVVADTQAEFAILGVEDYSPTMHTNLWRTPDGRASGLDCWVELHYNWVRLDQSVDEIGVKGSASGEFSMLFEGADSQSRLLVRGAFNVDKIKKDRWVNPVLENEKLIENETVLCGESYAEE